MLIKTWRLVRRVLPAPLFCFALALTLPQSSPASAPDTADQMAWVPNAGVSDVIHRGSHTIVSGAFSWWGPYGGAAIRISPTAATAGAVRGQVVAGGGSVFASVSDGSGGAYIGGNFTVVGGVEHRGLAHITAGGSVDPDFGPQLSGSDTVNALALSGGTLFVGGHFTSISGTPRRSLGAVNASNGAVTSWATCTHSSNTSISDENTIHALAVIGSTVYIGGTFTSLGVMNDANCDDSGATRDLGSVSASTGLQTSWRPDPNGAVQALVANGTTLYVGGRFSSVSSGATVVTRQHAAAFNTSLSSATATAWDPHPDGDVYALARGTGSTMVLGGAFTMLNPPTDRGPVAVVDGSTGAEKPFKVELDSGAAVYSLAVSGSHLLVGGSFTVGERANLEMVDLATGNGEPLAIHPSGGVLALTSTTNGLVVAGGLTSSWTAVRHDGLAILDVRGIPTSVAPLPRGYWVQQMAVAPDGQSVYVYGVSPGVAHTLRKIDVSSGQLLPWAPDAPSKPTDRIATMHVSGDGKTLYVGGTFGSIGGAPRANAAAFSTETGAVTSWRPDPDGSVNAIADAGDQIYMGGDFQHIGSGAEGRTGLARVSATTATTDPSWAPTLDGGVNGMALSQDGVRLYIAGSFAKVGSPPQARGHGAAVSTTTGNPTPFNPSLDGDGYDVAVGGDDADVYMTGHFSSMIGGPGAAAFGAADGTKEDWNPTGSPYYGYGHIDAQEDNAWLGSDSSYFGADARPFYAQFTSVPVIRASPRVLGDPTPGQTLTCQPGVWRNGTESVTVEWDTESAAIPGATDRTYVVRDSDIGHRILCWEFATNVAGTAPASSAQVAVTVAPAPTPTPAAPTVTPPPTPTPTPAPGPGLAINVVAKKTRFARSRGTSLTVTLSAPAAVTVTVSRCPAHGACKKPKRVRVLSKALPKGRSLIAIGEKKHRLATGRYLVAASARGTDGRTVTAKPLTLTASR